MVKVLLLVCLLLIGYGITTHYEDKETERQAKRYCQMVAAGAWEDYLNTYADKCLPQEATAAGNL